METQANFPPPELILDDPSTVDLIEGHAHERVAKTVADLIRSHKGGRAIGLEGSWGGGKSTVIELVAAALRANADQRKEKHSVLVFDAWAHLDDPVRRVFLEELIEQLRRDNAIDKVKWDRELSKYREESKTIRENIRENLTFLAKILILILPVYAASSVFLDLFKAIGPIKIPLVIFTLMVAPWFCVLVLLALPYLILFGMYIGLRTTWQFSKIREMGFGVWLKEHGSTFRGRSLLKLFTRETDERVIDQTIRQVDTTTTAFNRSFDGIVLEARANNTKAVIVLDNLDRLPAPLLRSTWALMRNFFASSPNSERRDAVNNVWLIVPFDRHHIETVFRDEDGQSTDDGEGSRPTRGFIEKTFAVVLRVPPPVLSDAYNFFHKLIDQAFKGRISVDDTHTMFKLFDDYQQSKSDPITPRAVKSYINTIVVQMRQWGDIIPPVYHALYALFRQEITRDPPVLRNPEFPPPMFQVLVDTGEMRKYLAAIHFNVEPDRALQFIMGQQIASDLAAGRSDDLAKLSRIEGFEIVLNDVVRERAVDWTRSHVGEVFQVMNTLGVISLSREDLASKNWRAIARAVIHHSQDIFYPVEIVSPDGAVELIKRAPTSAVRPIAVALTRCLTPVNAAAGRGAINAFVDILRRMVNAVSARGVTESVTPSKGSIVLPSNDQLFLDLAAACGGQEHIRYTAFRAVTNIDLNQLIAAEVNLADTSERLLPAVEEVVFSRYAAGTREGVVAALQTRIQQNSPAITPTKARELLDLVALVGATSWVVSQNFIYAFLTIGCRGGDPILTGRCVAHILADRGPALVGPPAVAPYGDMAPGNNLLLELKSAPSAHEDIIAEIMKTRIVRDQFYDVLKFAIGPGTDPEIYRIIVRRVLESGDAPTIQWDAIVKEFEPIEAVLGDELSNTFVKSLASYRTQHLPASLKGDGWTAVSSALLKRISDTEAPFAKVIWESIQKGLDQVDANAWPGHFNSADDHLRLLFDSVRLRNIGLPYNLSNSLYEIALQFANDVVSMETRRSDWDNLLLAANSGVKHELYSRLRDWLVETRRTPAQILSILTVSGPSVRETLNGAPDKIIVNILVPLVEENSPAAFAAINGNIETFASKARMASSAAQQTLQYHLSNRVSESQDNSWTGIADGLGIPLASKPPESRMEETDRGDPET